MTCLKDRVLSGARMKFHTSMLGMLLAIGILSPKVYTKKSPTLKYETLSLPRSEGCLSSKSMLYFTNRVCNILHPFVYKISVPVPAMIWTPVSLLNLFKNLVFRFIPMVEFSTKQPPPDALNFFILSIIAFSPATSAKFKLSLWEYLNIFTKINTLCGANFCTLSHIVLGAGHPQLKMQPLRSWPIEQPYEKKCIILKL